MGKFNYSKKGDLSTGFDEYLKQTRRQAAQAENILIIKFNERVLALTPVWEGELIRNWTWSATAPVYAHVDPVASPAEPGPTGTMRLGEEPRRGANIIHPLQTLVAAMHTDTPVDMFLTNASPIAVDAEYGLVPTKERSRSNAGIVRLAMREVFGSA